MVSETEEQYKHSITFVFPLFPELFSRRYSHALNHFSIITSTNINERKGKKARDTRWPPTPKPNTNFPNSLFSPSILTDAARPPIPSRPSISPSPPEDRGRFPWAYEEARRPETIPQIADLLHKLLMPLLAL